MKIIGPDALLFGVDDVATAETYLVDVGLTPVGDGRFEALDGTALIVKSNDDPSLPPALPTGNSLRKQIFGVVDEATVDAIAAELSKDRKVDRLADGSIEAWDDAGFRIGFQVTCRRPLELAAERINAPGATPQRAINEVAVTVGAPVPKPRTLAHYALFTPDAGKCEAFYVSRLGFRVTDRLTGAGMFLQSAATHEHHRVFFIQTPPQMQGLEHLALHLGGPGEVFEIGSAFAAKGYQSFWGPGRHIMGSNWFWYFNSPFGCRFEFDADMDQHDETWTPRVAPAKADSTQIFLFQQRELWAPVGGPPRH